MPKDPGFIRVSTPPRVITMNHHFPTATDDDDDEPKSIESINNDMNNRDINRQQRPRPTGFNTSDLMMSRR
jgi:mitochondrial fission factor